MNKFEFIVRSEMILEAESQLYRMFGSEIPNYDLTLDRIINLSVENILMYNDFIVDDWEYESGIAWCVEVAIENILEVSDIVN